MVEEIATPKTIAIYVHWPFCLSLCPYCDFNSHVRDNIDYIQWQKSLVKELKYYAKITGKRDVKSVFFGGGTPSLMPPSIVEEVINEIANLFNVNQNTEITLEANPTSAESNKFKEFARAGINRVSLGVQALNDDALNFLGRNHNLLEAEKAIDIIGSTFDRYSFDLIYNRPNQSVNMWVNELQKAIKIAKNHLSVYQLTIEPGTPFYLLLARGALKLPNEDISAALYEITQEILSDAGMEAYEISNHASPGEACRHNLVYWQYGDYIGIGPGAHGRVTVNGRIYATRQHRAPEIWLRRVEENGHATQTYQSLDRNSVINEMIIMGLRISKGIDAQNFLNRTGTSLKNIIDQEASRRLQKGGFIIHDNSKLLATYSGRQRLDSVISSLIN